MISGPFLFALALTLFGLTWALCRGLGLLARRWPTLSPVVAALDRTLAPSLEEAQGAPGALSIEARPE